MSDKAVLKSALSSIWAIVYRSSQIENLSLSQIEELQYSMNVISHGRPNDPYFRGRVSLIVGAIRTSGLLSIPPRRPKGYEGIMKDCDHLQQYLDNVLDPN